MTLEKLIAVARGEVLADLLLTNARIVNTFTAEIEKGNVAICQGRIAGIGDYRQAKQTIDLEGKYLAPGLINGHIHIESSMLHIAEYAKAVVPRGTSTIVTDLWRQTDLGAVEWHFEMNVLPHGVMLIKLIKNAGIQELP